MKAIITIEDLEGNSFQTMTQWFGPRQENGTNFNPASPSHVAAVSLIEHLDKLAQKLGQPIVKGANEVTVQEMDERQQMALYEVLGKWRDQMPIAAVNEFQRLLGPLPSHVVSLKDVALARPRPEEIAGN